RRYGMPSTVIDRAKRFLSREDQNFESFETSVKKLNDERAALDLARQAAETREREAETLRVRLEAELHQAKARDRQLVSRGAEQPRAGGRRAREDLRAAQATLRAKKLDEGQLREAARILERVAGEVAIGGELEPLVVPQDRVERGGVRADVLRKG